MAKSGSRKRTPTTNQKNNEKKPVKVKNEFKVVFVKKPKSRPGKAINWCFDWKICLIVPLIAILCFANTYKHEFTFDDQAAIKTNKDLHLESPIYNIFIHNYWGSPIKEPNAHKSYRPLTTLTFKANYILSELNASSYHIVNIVFHAFVSYLGCVLCYMLFNKKRTAFLSGIIFAIHPLHCDAVASVVGRAEILGGIFYCSSMIVFIGAVGSFRHQVFDYRYSTGNTNWIYFGVACFLSACGLIAKELAYLSCVLFGVYEILSLYREERLVRFGPGKISFFNSIKCLVFYIFSSPLFPTFVMRQFVNFVVFCAVMYCRYEITHSTQQYIISHFNYISESDDKLTRTLSIPYFQLLHWRPLVYPVSFCCDCSYNSVPLITSIFDIRNLATFSFYLLILIIVPHWMLTVKVRHSVPLLFSYFVAVLPYIPCANLWFWTGFEVAERIMYLPSLGFCYVAGHFLGQFLSKKNHGMTYKSSNPSTSIQKNVSDTRSFYYICFTGIFCLLITVANRCVMRNRDWENQYTLWESAIKVYPNNAKAHYNFANEVFKKGTTNGDAQLCLKAIEHYKSAFSQRHDGSYTHNYGYALYHLGALDEAEDIFWKGINNPLLAMDGTPVHRDHLFHALGDLYTQKKMWKKARECYEEECLAKMHFNRPPSDFLKTLKPAKEVIAWAQSSKTKNRYKAKLFTIDQLLDGKIKSGFTEGQKLFSQKKFQEAIPWYFAKLNENPGHDVLLFETSILLQLMGRVDDALYLLHHFVKINKFSKDAYSLMGKLFQDNGREVDALRIANLLEPIKALEKMLGELTLKQKLGDK